MLVGFIMFLKNHGASKRRIIALNAIYMIFDFILHPLTTSVRMVRNLLYSRWLIPLTSPKDHELSKEKTERTIPGLGLIVVGLFPRTCGSKRADPRMGLQRGK